LNKPQVNKAGNFLLFIAGAIERPVAAIAKA